MGYDYSSIHVFAGDRDPVATRAAVIEQIRVAIPCAEVDEERAHRSIVVGEPDRWIFVGDSAGSTERADSSAFNLLVSALSNISTTLTIEMSDTACVQMHLHANGGCIDKFGTGRFPFYPFESREEALSFRGVAERWLPFARSSELADMLRETWAIKYNADGIVSGVAEVLGIDRDLAGCGFSVFDEAYEIKYSDWLPEDKVTTTEFCELHFCAEELE